MEETVLCYIENDNQYLMLLRNKRDIDMNKGKWIGLGGHVEELESPDDAIDREVLEESGLTIINKVDRGIIYFVDDDYEELMHLYTCNNFSGTIHECNEGTLEWKNKNEIMSLNLWEGDRLFLPILLKSDDFIRMKLIYHKGKLVRSIEL